MKQLFFAMCLAAAAVDGDWTAPSAVQTADRPTIQGTWRADYDNYWTRSNRERWISLQLQYDQGNSGFGVPERDVPGLADRRSDGPVQFTLRRDAGRFDFTGSISSGRARGEFSFIPSGDFITGMQRLGYARLSDQEVWRFAMHDVSRDYVSEFRKAGYQLDTSELITSRIHGATPAFAEQIQQETKTRLDIDELVKMRIHGVTPEFIQAMRDMGYKDLSMDTLVKFRIHGVNGDFIKTFADLGYKGLDADELVKMRIHGVTPQFVRELSDLGYKNLPIEDLVRMRIHGVTPDYIRKMRDAGFVKLDVEQLVKLRIHGLDDILIRRSR